jgi:hypothetical protein
LEYTPNRQQLRLYLDGNATELTWQIVGVQVRGKLRWCKISPGKHVFYIFKGGVKSRFLYFYTKGNNWIFGTRSELKPKYAINRLSKGQREELPRTFDARCFWDAKFKGNYLTHPWKLKKAIRLDRKCKALEVFNMPK